MMKNISAANRNNLTKWLNRQSLRSRLTLFVLIVSLLPLMGIAIKDLIETRNALIEAEKISLSAGAQQTARSIDTFIDNSLDGIRIESQLNDFVKYLSLFPSKRRGSPEEIRAKALLNTLTTRDNTNIISYGLVDLTGIVILDSVDSNIGKNESGDEYFLTTINTKLPTASAVTYSENTTIIHFASYVRDESGETIGILRVEYNASILQQIVSKSADSSNARITILDEFNIRLADNQQPDLIQKSISPLPLDRFLLAASQGRLRSDIPPSDQTTELPSFEAGIKNSTTTPFFSADLNPAEAGDDSVYVAYMEKRPWVVVYSQPTSVFLGNVQSQTRTSIIVVILVGVVITLLTALISRSLTLPIQHLTETANIISQGNLAIRAEIETDDEIGSLAKTLNVMTDQLQANFSGLEARVAERTSLLERRSAELAIVAEVARDINTIQNVNTLLSLTVNLIRDRFNAYHSALYLIDDRSEFLLLRAASGDAGQAMINNRYRIRLNGPGIIAFVARTSQAHLAENVGSDITYIINPLLPETKSEIALPLRTGNSVIGVLDIQSTKQSAFTSENIQTMQLLADQIVVALENAQLLTKLETTLQELSKSRQAQTRASWQKTIEESNKTAMEYDGVQVRNIADTLPKDVLMKLQNGKHLVLNDINGNGQDTNQLLIPLMVLDEMIGVIGFDKTASGAEWTNEEINFAKNAANRAALSLENARLLTESQKKAAKEQAISNASNHIGSMQQIENILHATVEELEKTLGTSEIIIQFHNEEK